MHLVTYRKDVDCAARLGAVVGDLVVDLERLGTRSGRPLPPSMQAFIELGPEAVRGTSAMLAGYGHDFPPDVARPLHNVELLAPITRPRKNIFAVGLNYVDPDAGAAKGMPDKPVYFTKPPTTVVGPEGAIRHDQAITRQLDWEVEMAVIIGTRARGVPAPEALRYVFGYSLIVDITARDCMRSGQLLYAKGLDSYAPFGPAIVTADEIADPHDLELSLAVNGATKQSSSTRYMYFKVDTLISDLSQGMTLEPGDIIATGTPGGIGARRSPQEWLWPGDVVDAHLEGVGSLHSPVIAV
ncbi:MAG TPA: fumarylacetoacetate hydrolase family protein [Nevskiaceae bacterium]